MTFEGKNLFRKGHPCTDNIYTLQQLIEKRTKWCRNPPLIYWLQAKLWLSSSRQIMEITKIKFA